MAEILVVDSGGFLKNAPLRDLGDQIVTLQDVVAEIRDKETRQRLQVLPYELTMKQPTSQALKIVAEFSKKTGDYASLSATDLKVLAVAYDLEVEHVGTDHLNKEPKINKTVEFYKPGTQSAPNASDAKMAGFFEGEEEGEKDYGAFEFWREPIAQIKDSLTKESGEAFTANNFWREPIASLDDDFELPNPAPELSKEDLDSLNCFLETRSFLVGFGVSATDVAVGKVAENFLGGGGGDWIHVRRWLKQAKSHFLDPGLQTDVDLEEVLKCVKAGKEITAAKNDARENGFESSTGDEMHTADEYLGDYDENFEDADEYEDSGNEEGADDETSSGDDGGWITPGNLKEKKKQMGHCPDDAAARVRVACMTTDFAMQNVLKQLGLQIMSVDGMIIKHTKTWILRCYSCYATTPLMHKQFCVKCGNKTLKRVSVTLNEDGSQQIHISARRPLNKKGKKYSLPAPKGGKHAFNPRIFEDQREAEQRLSKKAIIKNNPMDSDYIAGNSPFSVNDVTSKSAQLGLKGGNKGNAKVSGKYWNKRNPNAPGKKTGNRKRNDA